MYDLIISLSDSISYMVGILEGIHSTITVPCIVCTRQLKQKRFPWNKRPVAFGRTGSTCNVSMLCSTWNVKRWERLTIRPHKTNEPSGNQPYRLRCPLSGVLVYVRRHRCSLSKPALCHKYHCHSNMPSTHAALPHISQPQFHVNVNNHCHVTDNSDQSLSRLTHLQNSLSW